MNKISIFILFVVLYTPVRAAITKIDICLDVETLARSLMEHRQSGTSLETILEIITMDNARKIALSAYEKPRYRVKKNQDNAINEFANKWFSSCLNTQVPSSANP